MMNLSTPNAKIDSAPPFRKWVCAMCDYMYDEEAGDRAAYDALTTPPPFRALLVDVNLGQGATGYDVARFARQAIPGIAVIYVSGDASRGTFEQSGVPDSDFIAKPFTAAQLLATVQRRIGTSR